MNRELECYLIMNKILLARFTRFNFKFKEASSGTQVRSRGLRVGMGVEGVGMGGEELRK